MLQDDPSMHLGEGLGEEFELELGENDEVSVDRLSQARRRELMTGHAARGYSSVNRQNLTRLSELALKRLVREVAVGVSQLRRVLTERRLISEGSSMISEAFFSLSPFFRFESPSFPALPGKNLEVKATSARSPSSKETRRSSNASDASTRKGKRSEMDWVTVV
jgi:hypothetical protein